MGSWDVCVPLARVAVGTYGPVLGPVCKHIPAAHAAAAAAARDDSFGAFAPVMVSPVRRMLSMSLPDLYLLYGLSNE